MIISGRTLLLQVILSSGALMLETEIDWSVKLKQIFDTSLITHIPPDITFNINEDQVIFEIDAHKMVMGMASPVFNKMFFKNASLDRLAEELFVMGTTKAAFTIMKDAIYGITPLRRSLKGKSVPEVFSVLGLVSRYQIRDLRRSVQNHLASFPLTDETVLEVATAAMDQLEAFEDEARKLLDRCAEFLKPKFNSVESVLDYFSEHSENKETLHELLVLIKDNIDNGRSMKNVVVGSPHKRVKNVVDRTTFNILEGKRAPEVFVFLDLMSLFKTSELRDVLQKHLASVPSTNDNVVEVEGDDKKDKSEDGGGNRGGKNIKGGIEHGGDQYNAKIGDKGGDIAKYEVRDNFGYEDKDFVNSDKYEIRDNFGYEDKDFVNSDIGIDGSRYRDKSEYISVREDSYPRGTPGGEYRHGIRDGRWYEGDEGRADGYKGDGERYSGGYKIDGGRDIGLSEGRDKEGYRRDIYDGDAHGYIGDKRRDSSRFTGDESGDGSRYTGDERRDDSRYTEDERGDSRRYTAEERGDISRYTAEEREDSSRYTAEEREDSSRYTAEERGDSSRYTVEERGDSRRYTGGEKRDSNGYLGDERRDSSRYTGDERGDSRRYTGDERRDSSGYLGDERRDGSRYIGDERRDGSRYIGDERRDGSRYTAEERGDISRYNGDERRDSSRYNGDKRRYSSGYNGDDGRYSMGYKGDGGSRGGHKGFDRYDRDNDGLRRDIYDGDAHDFGESRDFGGYGDGKYNGGYRDYGHRNGGGYKFGRGKDNGEYRGDIGGNGYRDSNIDGYGGGKHIESRAGYGDKRGREGGGYIRTSDDFDEYRRIPGDAVSDYRHYSRYEDGQN